MRVLAVKPKYAHNIIDGKKTIEVRSRETRIRERIAIYATSPEQKIIGTVEIVASSRCNDEIEYEIYKNEHLAPSEYYQEGKTCFWHLRRHLKFETPISYKPPKGAVVWSIFELPEDK